MDSSEGHPEDKLKEQAGLDGDLIIDESSGGDMEDPWSHSCWPYHLLLCLGSTVPPPHPLSVGLGMCHGG